MKAWRSHLLRLFLFAIQVASVDGLHALSPTLSPIVTIAAWVFVALALLLVVAEALGYRSAVSATDDPTRPWRFAVLIPLAPVLFPGLWNWPGLPWSFLEFVALLVIVSYALFMAGSTLIKVLRNIRLSRPLFDGFRSFEPKDREPWRTPR